MKKGDVEAGGDRENGEEDDVDDEDGDPDEYISAKIKL